jgi:hypothetical protein
MAKKPKATTELKEPEVAYERTTETVYLTKRILERAVKKGTKNLSKEQMELMGYVVIAEDGWVVKIFKDGTKEKISPISTSNVKWPLILD